MDGIAEAIEELFKSACDGSGTTVGEYLDMDKTGGALDSDEDISALPFEAGGGRCLRST